MTPQPKPTADTIAADLARFIAPTQVTELRALHVGARGRTFAGYFLGTHLRDMARHALALAREAAGVYFVPNPIFPDLLSRRTNTTAEARRGQIELTRDADIAERRYMILDLDPRRWEADRTTLFGPTPLAYSLLATPIRDAPTLHPDPHAELPASAREVAFAHRAATRTVIPWMRSHGWRDPIEMMSGNGIHLVYPLPKLSADDPTTTIQFAELFRAFEEKFSCFGFRLDANTRNPCRMLKVPGTTTRKGEPTTDRPHRTARIVKVPNGWIAPEPCAHLARGESASGAVVESPKPPNSERTRTDTRQPARKRVEDSNRGTPASDKLERQREREQPKPGLFG